MFDLIKPIIKYQITINPVVEAKEPYRDGRTWDFKTDTLWQYKVGPEDAKVMRAVAIILNEHRSAGFKREKEKLIRFLVEELKWDGLIKKDDEEQ